MLEIYPVEGPPVSSDIAALLFTSANGVRFGARRLAERGMPVFCVGRRTAQAARAAGFGTIEHAGGDARDLARLVSARLDPGGGALLHLCGRERKAELGKALRAAGFDLRETPVYEARLAACLPAGVRARLETGDIDLVLVYSERTARRLAELLVQGEEAVLPFAARLGALSAAAARPLEDRFSGVIIADKPEEASLMAAMAQVTGASFPARKETKPDDGGP